VHAEEHTMPKFSDKEKEMIRDRLRSEGEKLFSAHGLRKVTVDDIVQAAGIAKGSFYSFYENKEYLFMDINNEMQRKVWEKMTAILEQNKALPARDLTKMTFHAMSMLVAEYPMIAQLQPDTIQYLMRKLPSELIEEHTKEDSDSLQLLEKYGVQFTCDRDLAAKVFQYIFIFSLSLSNEEPETQRAVMEIILNGTIDQIVREEK